MTCTLQVSIAQAPFQKIYTSLSPGYINTVIEEGSEFVFCGVSDANNFGGKNALLGKVNENGDLLWARTYGGAGDDRFTLVIEANDGGYLALGDTRSQTNGEADIFVLKTDATGNPIWSKTFGGTLLELAPGWGSIVPTDDGYVLSGMEMTTQGNGSHTGTFLVRIKNDGSLVWSHNFDSPNSNLIVANRIDNGKIIASGYHSTDGCFATFDLTTGNSINVITYKGSSNESLYHLRPTIDGNYLISDSTWSPFPDSISNWVMKITPDGTPLWSKVYRAHGHLNRGPAAPTPDGGAIVTGWNPQQNNQNEAFCFKIASDGSLEWSVSLGKEDKSENLYLTLATANGDYVAVGRAANKFNVQTPYMARFASPGAFGSCCERDQSIKVIDFPTQVINSGLQDVTPFDLENWPNMQHAAVNLFGEPLCASPTPPNIEATPILCGSNALGSIAISSTSGSTFSLNGGQFLPPTTYNLLAAGTYTVTENTTDNCLLNWLTEIESFTYQILDSVALSYTPCQPVASATAVLLPGPAMVNISWDQSGWVNSATSRLLPEGLHTLTAQDANGCTDTILFEVVINSIPKIDTIKTRNIDCNIDKGLINIDVIGGVSPYEFSYNNGAVSSANLLEVSNPGNYAVTITDQNGCTTTSGNIEIRESKAEFGTQTLVDICDFERYVLGDGTAISSPGEYKVTLKAVNGCDSISTVTLGISSLHFFAPNVFHPDNNGENDFFTLFTDPTCVQEIGYLRVFDRWGSLVFERKNFAPGIENLGWSGDEMERPAPTAIYIFDAALLLRNGQSVQVSGDITLLR